MSASTQNAGKDTRTAAPAKPIRCLVIQLTRLGDTLQSLMALRAAKQLYPQLEIHFVARERFAAAAKRTPWIESVITLPTDQLLGPVLRGEREEKQALGDLARWAAPLVERPWDLVVNWSYSESSSFLAALVPARVKLGYTRNRSDMQLASTDGWSHYIQAIVQGGIHQNIHLTDVLTTQLLTALQIHHGDPANEGNAPVTSKSFFQLEIGAHDLSWGDFTRKWIGIQLGAGSAAKTWPAASWARFARKILKNHPECSIVLLGGPEDAERSREFFRELDLRGRDARNVISLVGETDFDLWASVVGRCAWIVAGDTAAVHLASVLGTRVLNVSIGPVRWSETGPYGNGHYVISSHKPCAGCEARSHEVHSHSCRADVTAEAVYAAWSYAASEWAHRRQTGIAEHFRAIGAESVLDADSIRVHRSRIRGSNDGGGVVYEPLIERPLSIETWLGMVNGHIARSWYCGWVPAVGTELKREMISPPLIQRLRELGEATQVLAKICEQAGRSAKELKERSSRLRSDKIMGLGERDELRALGRKLLDLDSLVDRMGKAQPPLAGFSQMSKVLMHNLKGEHLADLGAESASCYRQLGEGVAILGDWLKHTIGLARPMAVVSEPSRAGRAGETSL
jgi:ADP-heptose:LPS heptosyltransferase